MFYKEVKNKDGLNYSCIECVKEKQRQSHINNKEKSNERCIKYYYDNKEKILELRKTDKEEAKIRSKQWYERNKKRALEYSKKYKKSHKEDVKKYIAKYKIENVEKYRAKNRKYTQTYLSKKQALVATLTTDEWEKIKKVFNNKCAYCGADAPLAQEHFLALSKGGEYTHNNIIPSCKSCNSSKHTRDFFEWYPKYEKYSKNREKKILKHLGYQETVQQLSVL
jgi:5-methylcytosine-specific restriction endonuclease McrA